MYLDRQHPIPVYLQLKKMLQNQIEQGVYCSHQKLPSERDLCRRYSLSRMTVRKAVKQLIVEGFAYTKIGKGTYVDSQRNELVKTKTDTLKPQKTFLNNNEIIWLQWQQQLIEHLRSFNCYGVEQTISNALSSYSIELVAIRLFPQVIRQLEQLWHNRELTLLAHNYAITTLRSQLITFNTASNNGFGPKLLLACTPEDQHEMGLLLIALSLRRRGFAIIYLGPNTVMTEFQHMVDYVKPQLICFSAATTKAAENLAIFSSQFHKENKQKRLFTYGGVIFKQNPNLNSTISGIYLGDSIENAVTTVQDIFS